jgi:hypothetical protein
MAGIPVIIVEVETGASGGDMLLQCSLETAAYRHSALFTACSDSLPTNRISITFPTRSRQYRSSGRR